MAHEDHTIRALHAALGLQQALSAYANELQRTRAITLDVGMGIHTGPVVVGTSDNAARPGYTAQGFAIYLAERLQALVTGGAICVSAAVQQQAAGFFRFDDHGVCTLPDITQPLHVYTCTGVAQGTLRLEAFLHRYRSQFLGRERDMDLLGTLWARARRGQGQVVLLFGEAGVGKSRLAYEFQRTLAEGRRLQAQTLSYGQSMSYHVMIPLLRTLLGLTDHNTLQQQRQHLHACLAAAQPSLAADEPLLAHLLGVPLEPDQLPTLPPEERKRRLQHACLQVMLQHAAEQPLCLLIEDLHWLDNSSQELLDLVVTSSARQPVLLLGTARPGFQDTWADRSYFHRLTVEPLSDEYTDTFIHNYFRPHDACAALKALIRARTAGNPFFVEEMLRTLQEHALIVLQDGVYVLKPDAHLDIPASVHGVLAARIDRLPSEAKHLLQTAAVIGTEVPVALLGTIAELSDKALHHGFMHLQAAELLYETRRFPEHVYTFKYALTHEVAYAVSCTSDDASCTPVLWRRLKHAMPIASSTRSSRLPTMPSRGRYGTRRAPICGRLVPRRWHARPTRRPWSGLSGRWLPCSICRSAASCSNRPLTCALTCAMCSWSWARTNGSSNTCVPLNPLPRRWVTSADSGRFLPIWEAISMPWGNMTRPSWPTSGP
jgi:hypothetical protein